MHDRSHQDLHQRTDEASGSDAGISLQELREDMARHSQRQSQSVQPRMQGKETMINKRALEKAINDTMREQFAAQMREFICYGAPKEITELYKRYVDECIAADKRRAKRVEIIQRVGALLVVAVSIGCIFAIGSGRA